MPSLKSQYSHMRKKHLNVDTLTPLIFSPVKIFLLSLQSIKYFYPQQAKHHTLVSLCEGARDEGVASFTFLESNCSLYAKYPLTFNLGSLKTTHTRTHARTHTRVRTHNFLNLFSMSLIWSKNGSTQHTFHSVIKSFLPSVAKYNQ